MSTEQKLTPGDVLFQHVYLPAFRKVAQLRGHAPASDEELVDQLKIAAYLRMHEQAAAQQQLQAGSGVTKEAAARLEAMTLGSVPNEPAEVTNVPAVKEALSQLCGD